MKSVKPWIAVLSLVALPVWAGQPPLKASRQAHVVAVPSDFWEKPRTGKAVLEQAALRQSVSALLRTPDSLLVIHHNDDEEASLRAEELRAWLIALGVDATWIDMVADLSGSDELQIRIARP